MKITCPHCNAIVQAENIDLSAKIAKCTLCDSVFNCAEQLTTLGGGSSQTGNNDFTENKEVALPRNMKVAQTIDGLKLYIKWFSPKFIFLTFFCVIWDGMILFFISTMLTTGEYFFLLFLSLHIATGVGLTYYTLAGYLNTTTITVDRETLKVKIGPLPWPGSREIESREVKQLYCKDKISRGRNGSTSVTYAVHLQTRQGKDLKLVNNLSLDIQAFYIEQEIERFLRIRNEAVRGEIRH